MISFPVTPAPAGLSGAPAGAAPPPDGAAQFLELLKQMTAGANAGVAPMPADAKPAVAVGLPLPLPAADAGAPVTSLTAGRARTAPTVADAPGDDQKDAVDDPARTNTDAVIVAPAPLPTPVTPTLAANLASTKTTDTPDKPALQALTSAADATDATGATDPATPQPLPATSTGAAPTTPELPAGPKFNVTPKTETQAASGTDRSGGDAASVASATAAPPPVAPMDNAAMPSPASGKPSSAAAARDAAAAPVAVMSQNAPTDAGMSKRDSKAGTSDRRDLDALAPRAAAPAPQASAQGFQLAADVRQLLSSGQIGAVISSSGLPGGTLTVGDTADLPQQIVQAMRFQLNNAGGGDAHIRLQPEYLGDLTISLRVERGDVNATLSASAPEVRQWIESHEPMLRQMLSDRGLQLSEFVVNDERQPDASQEEKHGRDEREPKPPARRRAAQDATFEVLA